MKKAYVVAAVLIAASWAAPVRSAPTAGSTKEQFGDIVRKLRANAELWSNERDINVAAEIGLKSLTFDKDSVRFLNDLLRTTALDANGLYVANRLLRQLSFADTVAIRTAVPTLKELHTKARKTYKAFPQLTERQIKYLKEPSENTSKGRAALEERRRRKIAREKPLARHNEMVYLLEERTFQIMLLAKDTAQDEVLTDTLIQAEKDRSAIFLTLIDAFATDARKMLMTKQGKERADAIYQFLRPHAIRLKMEPKHTYVNRGKAVVKEDDATTYERSREYPGLKLLGMLNRIATAAKMPALKVPKPKDVEKGRGKADPKKRTDRDKRRKRANRN